MTTSSLRLSALYRYPLKSCAGEALERAQVHQEGIVGDRRLMLARPDGRFITARTHPRLELMQVQLGERTVVLRFPGHRDLELVRADFALAPFATEVWGDRFEALTTSQDADAWCSEILGETAQLLCIGERSPRYRQSIDQRVGFADGYPLLLIGEGSLADLNARLAHSQGTSEGKPHIMAQFRPNLVVAGSDAFAEDGWQRLRIGEVELGVAEPCSRCAMITVDPATGTFLPGKEPLKTLATYRRGEKGKVLFGQNLVVLKEGRLALGDEVEILA
ncbi:MOSC domain-containing protein [Halomonas sp. I5-271120]|uniref:MOSC domain-containing protein n=1 Tax=Halomonas sp. I5-271120 TaxID=3061632 RepID=UPI002714D6E6|nr:MOSC N-terminal beta barrel domain-containing protein [Halomonas sp. I5-271120]